MLVAGITAHSPRPLCFAVERVPPGSQAQAVFIPRALQTNGDGRSWQVDREQQPTAGGRLLPCWRGRHFSCCDRHMRLR